MGTYKHIEDIRKEIEEKRVGKYTERKKWRKVERKIMIRFFVIVVLVGLIVLVIL